MKKILMLILPLVIAISTVIPTTTPVAANTERMTYLGMNITEDGHDPFLDARVRTAIYLALDRDSIAMSRGGTKVVSLVNPSTPNPAVNRPYNITLADQLLFNAGYPDGFWTELHTPEFMAPLASDIAEDLADIGIVVEVITYAQVEITQFFSLLQSKSLPFFLVGTPVDNTYMPPEVLGRLLLSDGPQNFTGYNDATFDSLFNSGQYFDAENQAFSFIPSEPNKLPIVPLFYLPTPGYTVRVIAASNDGPPAGVPIAWSKTGGIGTNSGSLITPSNIFHAGGDVMLTAPITHNEGIKFYLFKDWLVGCPPAPPDITTTESTVIFTADADKLATARYLHIINLGNIFPLPADVNPVGTDHTVWVDLPIPVEGVKVMFNILGANSEASDYTYTDATGRATFTYSGTDAGIDTVFAYIDVDNDGNWFYDDLNENGVYDTGEPCEPRTVNLTLKSWVENYITGAGIIKNENNEMIWKFNFRPKLGVSPEGGVVGQFQIIKYDSDDVVTYNMDQFEMLGFYGGATTSPKASNNTVRFRGTGTGSDGSDVLLLVIIEDADDGKDKIAVVELVATYPPPTPPDVEPWIGNIFMGPVPQDPPELVLLDGGNFQINNMR